MEIDKKLLSDFGVRQAIRLVIAGWMLGDGAEVEEVPELLEEIANLYREEIKKAKKR